jgi:DNA-binding MarR family transcriptional regulator
MILNIYHVVMYSAMKGEEAPSPAVEQQAADVLRELLGMAPLLNRRVIEGLGRRRLTQARARLLLILFDAGPLIITELAQSLDITPRAVTALVDGLDRTGFVRRSRRPTDRRATVVALTAKGRRTCADMRCRHARWATDVLGDADPHDLGATSRILGQVRAYVEKRPRPPA